MRIAPIRLRLVRLTDRRHLFVAPCLARARGLRGEAEGGGELLLPRAADIEQLAARRLELDAGLDELKRRRERMRAARKSDEPEARGGRHNAAHQDSATEPLRCNDHVM